MGRRGVIFDLDDTLITEEAFARASLRSAAELVRKADPDQATEVVLAAIRRVWRSGPHYSLAAELGIASWEGLWSRFAGCHPRLDGLADWIRDYRQEAWGSALTALGIRDYSKLAAAMAETFEQAQRSGHPLMHGAEESVRYVQGKVSVGLLTNGPADIQRLKLDQAGLANCFDAVVISGEVGIGKPGPEVFRLALDALGVRPQEAVMVGDSWERDVRGALGAGMSAVWIGGGRPAPETLPNVTVLQSVGELKSALRY